MKPLLLIPFLLVSSIQTPVFPLSRPLVFLEVKDATPALSSHSSLLFFESPKCLSRSFRFDSRSIPPTKFSFSGLKRLLGNRNLLRDCGKKDAVVISVKSYYRESGSLPADIASREVSRANEIDNYTPNLLDSLLLARYFFGDRPGAKRANEVVIKHQLLGLCVKCRRSSGKATESFQHFLVDRNANAEFPEAWNSKVRVIYAGEGDSCGPEDEKWPEKRSKGLIVSSETIEIKRKYTMERLMKDVRNYLKRFPVYNALLNCQHFAQNLYNRITRKNEEFISKEIMIVRGKDGETNESKLHYDFQ